MKNEKLKKYTVRFGLAFLIIIALLTYFSSTIDNILLPQVKVTQISYGTIDGKEALDDRYLVPISAVVNMGDTGSVFATKTDDNGKTFVSEITVNIKNSNGLYYEVSSINLYSDMNVVYSASKSISNGDRVYVLEK